MRSLGISFGKHIQSHLTVLRGKVWRSIWYFPDAVTCALCRLFCVAVYLKIRLSPMAPDSLGGSHWKRIPPCGGYTNWIPMCFLMCSWNYRHRWTGIHDLYNIFSYIVYVWNMHIYMYIYTCMVNYENRICKRITIYIFLRIYIYTETGRVKRYIGRSLHQFTITQWTPHTAGQNKNGATVGMNVLETHSQPLYIRKQDVFLCPNCW